MPICDIEYPDSVNTFELIAREINLNDGFTYVHVIRDTFDYTIHSKSKLTCSEYGTVIKTTSTFKKYNKHGIIQNKITHVIFDTTPNEFECPSKSGSEYQCITRQNDSIKCGGAHGRSGKGATHYLNDCQFISMKIGRTSSGLIYGQVGPKDSIQYENCPHLLKSKHWIPVVNDTIVISNKNKKHNIPLANFIVKPNSP
jgi:hypothetical protein